jgi:hypothetical protein
MPSCNATILKSFARRILLILKLKYELKKASLSLTDTNAAQSVKVSTEPKKSIKPTNLLKEIIKQSAAVSFEKKQWRCTLWNCTLPTVRGVVIFIWHVS